MTNLVPFQHFLGIHGLKKERLLHILDTTKSFISADGSSFIGSSALKNRTVVNLFFEPSTRTRSSFEVAAKQLGGNVLNFDAENSSIQKGESLLDTFKSLEAMHLDLFVVRHPSPGTAELLAQHALPHVNIINAGDGCHEHPTQAMLDIFTILQHKTSLSTLRIAIVGDVLHSRVARSQIYALTTLGVRELRIIAPEALLPAEITSLGVSVYHSLADGLAGVDVIIALRLQHERIASQIELSENEYHHDYGITLKSLALAKPGVIVMHPGPINRGVEIDSEVADGKNSLILKQITNGVAVRMAIMSLLATRAQSLDSCLR